VIKEFRTGEINVLIATAIVEEGLDIPKCNLVFRFNKPPNFSSYMQSKGRARAKQNASYVLLVDESDKKISSKDLTDYHNYEEIEKVSFIILILLINIKLFLIGNGRCSKKDFPLAMMMSLPKN
jgi:ERCC4-related helicase